jgi:hypothetical protein
MQAWAATSAAGEVAVVSVPPPSYKVCVSIV